MNTEIICALISVSGVILSCVTSYLVSKVSSAKEIKKLRLELEHNDQSALSSELSEALASAARFSNYASSRNQNAASGKIAAVRSKYSGSVGELLDELYNAVVNGSPPEVDRVLALLVTEERNRKTDNSIRRGKRPVKK